jgi:hypothetical protein
MIKNSIRKFPYLAGFSLVAVLFIVTAKNGFFWDTIQLGSEHAGFFLSTGFSQLLLPDSIDSGHIPAFGFYLALMWKIFGRSLIVSHLAMLPFIAGILWQLINLLNKLVKSRYVGWAFLIVLADPSLLSQMTLMSPDVLLVFFFLMGMNAILENRKIILSASLALLFLTSMRGMMVASCLFVIDMRQNIYSGLQTGNRIPVILKRSIGFLPAILIFALYNSYHFFIKGWIGFHQASPWATLFERVPLSGMIYNAGIIGWRLIDFGRIGLWILFLFLLLRFKKDIIRQSNARFLFFTFFLITVFLSINMIWARNLLCHRYLLPAYLSFSLLCVTMLFSLETGRRLKIIWISFLLIMMISGSFWVYPGKIATGWDATLAHLPYYRMRKEAIEYIDKQNIDVNQVQSFFPNISSFDDVDLNDDRRQFRDFNNSTSYVLYSNVFNVSDTDYDIIKNDFSVEKHFKTGQVYIDICRRKAKPADTKSK